ncbi:hypothetical protein [Corynebacterium liangguodongii]|uniref:hypothetical protein n=1 Tax=Corynebacterium liangguodongii TaxID=2079535 RepID=UPI001FCB5002|nr:hypothetical protein [Corynebacterium liangguodongii]
MKIAASGLCAATPAVMSRPVRQSAMKKIWDTPLSTGATAPAGVCMLSALMARLPPCSWEN